MPRLFPYMHVENFLDEDLSQQILAYAVNDKDTSTCDSAKLATA
jgi:SM-20-related protein